MTNNQKKQIGLIFAVIALFFGAFAANNLRNHRDSFSTNTSEQTTVSNTENVIPETNLSAPDTSDVDKQKQLSDKIASLAMPILMYHHIREYSFEKDTVGTQLSVAPNKFGNQLDLILQNNFQSTNFEQIATDNIPVRPIILTFDDGYSNFYTSAFPELKKRDMTAVVYIITGYIGKDGYMNENQIQEIKDYGIEVDPHTVNHPDLSSISIEKATTEITESRNYLQQHFNSKTLSFCYPSGKYNDSVVQTIQNNNFGFAVTTNPGKSIFSKPFVLSRERVNSDTNISGYLK